MCRFRRKSLPYSGIRFLWFQKLQKQSKGYKLSQTSRNFRSPVPQRKHENVLENFVGGIRISVWRIPTEKHRTLFHFPLIKSITFVILFKFYFKVYAHWKFVFYFVHILPLKVQSCKLYNKYMIASSQITNTEIFAFITFLGFKLLCHKILFINRKKQ